jgi:hypothetical protein
VEEFNPFFGLRRENVKKESVKKEIREKRKVRER